MPRIDIRATRLLHAIMRGRARYLRRREREKAIARVNGIVACAISANLKGPSK